MVESGSKSGLSQNLLYKVARSQILLRQKGFHFFLIFSSSFYCVPYGPLLPDTTVPANTIYSISFLGTPVQSVAFPMAWDGIWIKTLSISGKPFFFFFFFLPPWDRLAASAPRRAFGGFHHLATFLGPDLGGVSCFMNGWPHEHLSALSAR